MSPIVILFDLIFGRKWKAVQAYHTSTCACTTGLCMYESFCTRACACVRTARQMSLSVCGAGLSLVAGRWQCSDWADFTEDVRGNLKAASGLRCLSPPHIHSHAQKWMHVYTHHIHYYFFFFFFTVHFKKKSDAGAHVKPDTHNHTPGWDISTLLQS